MYNSSYTATDGGLGRDSVEGDVRDERATVGGFIKRSWGAKRGWCWHLCAYAFTHIYSAIGTKIAVRHEDYKMGYKSLQVWRERCFRLKVHPQTWFRIECQFVLDCLEILTLSNILSRLKWVVKVFSNLLTIDDDKHRISDHNYLIKVLQTCLWTPSRIIDLLRKAKLSNTPLNVLYDI